MRQQRGATLVLSLIILLVMSIIGLSASRIAVMDSRMSINLYDSHHAFLAADYVIQSVEKFFATAKITQQPAAVAGPLSTSTAAQDKVLSINLAAGEWKEKDATWWEKRKLDSSTYAGIATKALNFQYNKNNTVNASSNNNYVVEQFQIITPSLGVGTENSPSGRAIYRITGRGEGVASSDSNTKNLIQTTYAVLFQ